MAGEVVVRFFQEHPAVLVPPLQLAKPARDELIRQAAQGEVVHNDDTSMRVLKLEREPDDERTGVFTSGVVSTGQGQKIALYFTGRQHATGEVGRRAWWSPKHLR